MIKPKKIVTRTNLICDKARAKIPTKKTFNAAVMVFLCGFSFCLTMIRSIDSKIANTDEYNIESGYEVFLPTPSPTPVECNDALMLDMIIETSNGKILNFNVTTRDEWESFGCLYFNQNFIDYNEKYGRQLGIDPLMGLSSAAQSSEAQQSKGKHKLDGDKIGYFGFDKNYWVGKTVEYYNLETLKKEIWTITEDNLKDEELNVKLYYVLFQNCLKHYNYNVSRAIMAYYCGTDNFDSAMKKFTDECYSMGMKNIDCDSWLDYREEDTVYEDTPVIKFGYTNKKTAEYVHYNAYFPELIFKYIPDDSELCFKKIEVEGNEIIKVEDYNVKVIKVDDTKTLPYSPFETKRGR